MRHTIYDSLNNRQTTLRKPSQDLIYPDQEVNRSAFHLNGPASPRGPLAFRGNLESSQIDQMASNGISNGALRPGPIPAAEYDKKTSAQALFSSDGEEDATENRKQLEGVRAGSKDALSCLSRQNPGPSNALAHPATAQGLHDQQQMMTIQYLQNQLHMSQ